MTLVEIIEEIRLYRSQNRSIRLLDDEADMLVVEVDKLLARVRAREEVETARHRQPPPEEDKRPMVGYCELHGETSMDYHGRCLDCVKELDVLIAQDEARALALSKTSIQGSIE